MITIYKHYIFILVTMMTLVTNAFGQYHKTLPKGVRAAIFRNIQTNDVSSTYNQTKREGPIGYEIEANAKALEGIDNETIEAALGLYSEYPDAYNALSLGSYKIRGKANIGVNIYGMAYGVTDKLTAYFGVPFYKASVKINYQRKKGNNFKEVAEILQQYTNDDWAQSLGNLTEELPDLDGSTLQSIVMNNFGYAAVGDWQAEGPGDAEFGMVYNFYDNGNFGLSTMFGGKAPTGYVDDPDILQDIGFGDGQWDAFIELGSGLIVNKWLTLNTWARYSYQFASEKELRVPYSEELSISDEKAIFKEKLGDATEFYMDATVSLNDWLSLSPAYFYTHNEKATYNSEYRDANRFLSANTESVSHNFRMSALISSVNLFGQGKFPIPVNTRFTYSQMLEGRNTPKVDRLEFEFRMFF